MAKTLKKHPINENITENIITDNLEEILGQRFGRYSKYIIQDRALPDARDGLKPVQRRILYGMYRLGMFPNKPYKKSARIVGEVMGKYHPHGDSSIYEAMVRMSQSFKTLLLLIDMHGNNGSIDGDPAAAMRYTEARLSTYSEFLLKDLNKRTVGFVPNFDDEELEKYKFRYQGIETVAFPMSDKYMTGLYLLCEEARRTVSEETIEKSGLEEPFHDIVRLTNVKDGIFKSLLLDDLRYEEGYFIGNMRSILVLESPLVTVTKGN